MAQFDQNAYINNILQGYQSAAQQPTAQLGETQAAAGAAGASAMASTQQARETALQQQVTQNAIDKQNFKVQTQAAFDAVAKKNKGYVPPVIYNQTKGEATKLGIGDGEFDGAFEKPYTDPNNIGYATQTGRENQKAYAETQRKIGAVIDSYNQVPDWQKGYLRGHIESLGPIGQNVAPEAYSYLQTYKGLAAELKSIAGGGSGSGLRVTQTELDNWARLLPSPANSDTVNKKNIEILDHQIKATFNTPVGIDPQYLPKEEKTKDGKDLITKLLSNAGGDVKGIVAGAGAEAQNAMAASAHGGPNAAIAQVLGDTIKGTGNEYGQLLSNPLQHAQDHPVNTALDVLPFLAAGKAALASKAGGGATAAEAGAEAATAAAPKLPNRLQQIINPQGTKNAGSAIRDEAVAQAQKAGATIPGDNIVNGVNQWAEVAKKANPGDEAKIDATVESVKNQYAGKNVTPQDAVKIYNEVDSGYNRTGVQKETIQASRDIALRGIFGKELENVAPGWKQGTSAIAKGFKDEKGTVAQMKKNILPRAASAGLGLAGLDTVRHILGL